jgi:hypothetical protein
LTRFLAGSRKTIDRFPQGWVVGGSTHSTPSAGRPGRGMASSWARLTAAFGAAYRRGLGLPYEEAVSFAHASAALASAPPAGPG